MAQVTIETIKNGPYIVTGEVELIDAHGNKYPVEKRMALCRCGASTKSLNLAVKRNAERFPNDFMFRLTQAEAEGLRFQIGTSNEMAAKQTSGLRFQTETSKSRRGGRRYLPYAFTEQGVAMLSS